MPSDEPSELDAKSVVYTEDMYNVGTLPSDDNHPIGDLNA